MALKLRPRPCHVTFKLSLDVDHMALRLSLNLGHMAFKLSHVAPRPRPKHKPCHVAPNLFLDRGYTMWHFGYV
jgi:hypothetical protein